MLAYMEQSVLLKGKSNLNVKHVSKHRSLQTRKFDSNLIKISQELKKERIFKVFRTSRLVPPFWILRGLMKFFSIKFFPS